MGKTTDLFKKIRDIKGTFHAKMGTIKDKNSRNTEELYKKDLHDPDNHDGLIILLKPDILEWEVKCALGSITTNKASGGDGISVGLFLILRDDAVKVCTQYASKFWKLSSGHRTGKGQFSFQPQRKTIPKNAKTTTHCTHFTYQQSKAQNSPSKASTVCEPRTSRCSSWI